MIRWSSKLGRKVYVGDFSPLKAFIVNCLRNPAAYLHTLFGQVVAIFGVKVNLHCLLFCEPLFGVQVVSALPELKMEGIFVAIVAIGQCAQLLVKSDNIAVFDRYRGKV